MMKIVADESVDYRIINFLRTNSFDVTAIIDNHASISDTEVLRKSNEQNALLITEDKDFGELVFRFKLKHNGVLLLRFSKDSIDVINIKVLETLQKFQDCLLSNFSTLTDKKLRIRQTIT